ncbi:uncharacterized protein LOC126833067 [Adelges cooleyi]|uniref:uncharacterized protein LOC126833067 n=1 Tax=Adelges cooleyi TaxID=133065 RepID=UPI00217F92C5|nr:uncharacterized protein LOC126833067 [Adelges cooleyi]
MSITSILTNVHARNANEEIFKRIISQLETIYSEVKKVSAKANCPFGCFGCFGTVNKLDTRSYLRKHLSEYKLTMESMRAITEGLPTVDRHIKKKAFKDHMKQNFNQYYKIDNVVPSTGKK